MRKFLRKGIFFVFPILLIAVIAVSLFMAQNFHMDNYRIKLERASIFNDGWSVLTELPFEQANEALDSDTVILAHTLPEIIYDDIVLSFRTDSEIVRAYVDSQLVYSYEETDRHAFGDWFGSLWNMVPLSPEMSGKTITLTFTALNSESRISYHFFYLDHRGSIAFTLLLESWPIIINCLICLIACITMLISGFAHMRVSAKNARARIYLSAYILLGQFYVFNDAGLLQFLCSNKAVTHFLLYSSLMLLPAPFALYLAELFPRWAHHYLTMGLVYCGYYVLRLALYVTGILEIGQYISFLLVMLLAGMLCAVVMCILDTSPAASRTVLTGIISFCPFVFAAVFLYMTEYDQHCTTPLYSLTFSIGIDFLMFFFYIALLRNTESAVRHAQRYEHEAYTDALTRTRNRAAFLLAQSALEAEDHPMLTLLMVDLNNLKQVNDTLGHPAGDELICVLAQCLETAFEGVGQIYRYGGDEFIIASDAELVQVQAARAHLNRLLQQQRLHSGREISAAIGMASRQEVQNAHACVEELLHIADALMYQDKAAQKTNPEFAPALLHKRLEALDPVTGILSFTAFKARIYEALATPKYPCSCILSFDLNSFDGYNRLFGWDAGNLILQKLASMAVKLCGNSGFCGHDYADSFWVFANVPRLDVLTERIAEQTRAFQADLEDCLLFPSFGIYCVDDRMLPVSDMCSRAANAKKRIKGHLDVLYTIYSTEEHQRRIENMKLLSYMQKALDSNEFIPYYQPKFFRDGRLAGAEALARWPSSVSHSTSPAEFTGLFEKSGLILSLDWYMLEKTCRFQRAQLDAGHRCVPISNNFSRLHFLEADFLKHLNRIAADCRIPHDLIEVEFTETALVEDAERMFDLIAALQAEGFSVSLDGFGSGVSSLGSLNSLRVDTIKIDRSLIQCSKAQRAENCIFEFVVDMCHRLNIRSLAEGVETREQFDRLAKCGCELVQGNYFSPPLCPQDFEKLLTEAGD